MINDIIYSRKMKESGFMGGFSIVVLLGILTTLAIVIVAMIAITVIILILSYTFESIAIMEMRKKLGYKNKLICYIPIYNKLLLGEVVDKKELSIAIMITYIFLFLGILYLCFYMDILVLGIVSMLYIAIFVMNIILSEAVFKKYSKNYVLYTVLSVLSLGILRAIFLFAIRNNIPYNEEIIVENKLKS